MRALTYMDLLKRISRLSDAQLNQDVVVYDPSNDCTCEVICWGSDLDEKKPFDLSDEALVID